MKKYKQKFQRKLDISDKTRLKEISPNTNLFLKSIESNPLLVLILLISIVGFFIFKDYLLFKKLYIFKDIGSDTYNQAYPFYVHMANYIRMDGIPRWSFNVGMGQNIFPGCFTEPFNLIISLFSAKQIPYAIMYLEFLKIFSGGILFFLYLKTMKISSYVSIIGALSFAFSGYMIIGTEWYNFSTYCVYMAFTLFAFEKYLIHNNWKFLPPAIYLLSCYPFSFYAFGLFLLFYIPLRYFTVYQFKFKAFFIFILKFALLCFIGLIISFFIWGTTILITINSPRMGGDAGYFNALRHTPVFFMADKLHNMTAVLKLFSNDLMGTGSQFKGWNNYLEAPVFYCGLIALLAIPQLFFNGNKKGKIFSGITLFAWTLVVIFPFFRHTINLYTGDYYKVSISFIISLFLLYFSVKSLQNIFQKQKINLTILCITLGVLIFLLFYNWFPNSQKLIDHQLRIIIMLMLVLYAVMLYLLTKTSFKNHIIAILILIICFEFGYNTYISTNKRKILTDKEYKSKTGYNDYTIEALAYIKSNDKGFYRVNKNYFSGNSIHMSLNEAHIQDYFGTTSYMSFNNLSYINFLSATDIINPKEEVNTRWAIGLLYRPLLQTLASTKYQFSKPGGLDYTTFGYQNIGTFGDVTVLRNQYFLPLGFTYDKYITYSQFKSFPTYIKDAAIIKAVVINDKDIALYTGLVPVNMVDDSILQYTYNFDEYGQDVQNRIVGALMMSMHNQNNIKGDVVLNKRKLLFFSIPYDFGWKATVDGKQARLLNANIGFMGLLIDPGKHHIELSYSPSHFPANLFISLAGLIIYLICLIIEPINKLFHFNT